MSLIVATMTLPPVGMVGWLSPWLAASGIFPLAGASALAAGFCALVLTTAGGAQLRASASSRGVAFGAVALAASAWFVATAQGDASPGARADFSIAYTDLAASLSVTPSDTAEVAGVTRSDTRAHGDPASVTPSDTPERMTWAAVTTSTGKPPQTVDELAKRRSVILTATNEALRAGARVVVFPEQYAGSWSLGERYFIQGAIGPSLRNARATLLIGGDAKHQISGVKTNALLIYDGHTWDAVHANFAVPVSMWAPWRNDSYAVGWFEKNAIQIEGRNLVVSLCYEDFLVWPHLIALLGEQPDAFVSIANAWWAAGTDAIAVQRDHARLWAKVLGVPMIRALNAPS